MSMSMWLDIDMGTKQTKPYAKVHLIHIIEQVKIQYVSKRI